MEFKKSNKNISNKNRSKFWVSDDEIRKYEPYYGKWVDFQHENDTNLHRYRWSTSHPDQGNLALSEMLLQQYDKFWGEDKIEKTQLYITQKLQNTMIKY